MRRVLLSVFLMSLSMQVFAGDRGGNGEFKVGGELGGVVLHHKYSHIRNECGHYESDSKGYKKDLKIVCKILDSNPKTNSYDQNLFRSECCEGDSQVTRH